MTESKINVTKTSEIKKMQKDEKFYALGVVTRSNIKKDKNGRPYWDISIMDGDGSIEGKIWSNGIWYAYEDGGKDTIGDPLSDPRTAALEGKTLGLQGQIGEYKGQAQYAFNSVYYVDQGKYPPYSFVQRSPVPTEELKHEFRSLCDSCGEPLKGFLDFVFNTKKYWDKYKDWPAAVTHHHAYVGGLLEHSVAAARAANHIAKIYRSLGLKIDVDLVTAGALLHDIGKLEAYTLNPGPNMATAGNIIDHVALGYKIYSNLAEEYGLEKKDKKLFLAIAHIILSHHGSKEFGSPVLPASPEALIVSAADDLDFKLFCWHESVSALEDDKEITDFHFAMQRRFWRG
ncbi:MAG: HD domain-containing protein [Synergistaceae bacterium]|nr:HD domain-containing protein [Synergistaceae bacterium]